LQKGVKYEDKMPNWPAYKGELLFGQMPELIDGDFHVVQSKAIVRHLGRELSTFITKNEV
jgi:glutathione S-transferase